MKKALLLFTVLATLACSAPTANNFSNESLRTDIAGFAILDQEKLVKFALDCESNPSGTISGVPVQQAPQMTYEAILASINETAAIPEDDEKPKGKDVVITIKTSFGDMKVILFEETPQHKANFIKLAKEGSYDSTVFHRIIKEFMIQGGDLNSSDPNNSQPLGTGGPGYTIPAEFIPSLYHRKGMLSAARQSDNVNPEKASSGSQFYIVQGKVYTEEELTIDMEALNRGAGQLLADPQYQAVKEELMGLYEKRDFDGYNKKLIEFAPTCEAVLGISVRKPVPADRLATYTTVGGAPHLDDEYTVFGKVVEGIEVIDKIAQVQTDPRDAPLEKIVITMEIEEISKKKISKLYGYIYPEN